MTTPTDRQIKLIDLAYDRSCELLRIQHEQAKTSDQRALIIGGLCLTAASFFSDTPGPEWAPQIFAASAMFLLVSSVALALCVLSRKRYLPGGMAESLRHNIDADDDDSLVKLWLAEQNDKYIEKNIKAEGSRRNLYGFAIWFFAIGLLFAFFGLAGETTK